MIKSITYRFLTDESLNHTELSINSLKTFITVRRKELSNASSKI